MRIALDIDSTLHPYWTGFAEAARRRFGVDLPYQDQVTWEIDRLRPEQVRALVEETHRAHNILAADPYPGAVEVVSGWHAEGHEIHVMSHRDAACHGPTEQWLRRIGLPFHSLDCSWDKVAGASARGIELLVDDSPLNLQRALDEGMAVATLAHPWNRELCDLEGIVCAPDWPALGRRLAPLLSGQRTPG
jgi:uncharacterized HAD superfamily protein